LLGDTDYSAYQNYQSTLPQRGVVNQLQQSLSYTASPLTEAQADQLVQILAQNQPPGSAGAGQNVTVSRVVAGVGGGPEIASYVGPGGGFGGAPITDAAVAAARPVLNDSQIAALEQLQQQQAQMRAAMQSMGSQPAPDGGGVMQFRSVTPEPAPAPPSSTAKTNGGG
jgi:hypothetical protein